MKRSDMVKIIEKILNKFIDKEHVNTNLIASYLLDDLEYHGMLPPKEKVIRWNVPIIDCDWEKEDKDDREK